MSLAKSVFWVGTYVVHVNDLSFEQTSPYDCPTPRLDGDSLPKFFARGILIVAGSQTVGILFRLPNVRVLSFAQSCSRFGKCVQYCLQIKRRTADDLEHIGGGRLLLKGFAQLVQQPRVLNGDDSLGREVLQQLDLFVCEGPYLLAIDGDHADRPVILEHGHRKHGASTCELKDGKPLRIVGICGLRPNVGNLDRLSRDRSLMQANTRTSANYWFSLPRLGECRRCSIQGNSAVCIAFRKKQYTELRLAD